MKLPHRRQFLHLAASAAALCATVAQAQTETERHDLQERCGKYAAEVFAKEWGTGVSNTDKGQTIADYRHHYNLRLNKCFYLELGTTYPPSRDQGQYRRPAGALGSSRLFDLQESREIGTYHQLEDEIVACDVQGKECHSLLEYQALIKPFMED
jgi:hypothetical protein